MNATPQTLHPWDHERVLRLLACGCCRLAWTQLAVECQRAVAAAEEYADGLINATALAQAFDEALCFESRGCVDMVPNVPDKGTAWHSESSGAHFVNAAAAATADTVPFRRLARDCQTTGVVHRVAAATISFADVAQIQADLLPWRGTSFANEEMQALQRILLDDVFRQRRLAVDFDPAWRTKPAVDLAQSIYRERDFARLNELAALLTQAGCQHAAWLEHCRKDSHHVRGCWALDAVLAGE